MENSAKNTNDVPLWYSFTISIYTFAILETFHCAFNIKQTGKVEKKTRLKGNGIKSRKLLIIITENSQKREIKQTLRQAPNGKYQTFAIRLQLAVQPSILRLSPT